MSVAFARTTRALAAESSRVALVAWIVAALGVAAWLAWFVGADVTVYEVSRQARLQVARAPHEVSAELGGTLASGNLVIGRRVEAGEVLAELDTTRARLQWQEEQARQQAIPAKLASLQAEIAALQQVIAEDGRTAQAAQQAAQARVQEAGAGADFAREHGSRLRTESRAGSVAEVDALRAESDARRLGAARDALSADARRIELDAGTRAAQGRVQIEGLHRARIALQGELAASRATADRLVQEIDRHRIRAPIAGRIAEAQAVARGAQVAQGQKLATIVPDGDELLIVAEFDPATALGRLQPGQNARLRLDGFPWAQYGSVEAQVVRVSGEVRDRALRVELRPQPDAALRAPLQHGLSGSVEVGIERSSPARLLLRTTGHWLR